MSFNGALLSGRRWGLKNRVNYMTTDTRMLLIAMKVANDYTDVWLAKVTLQKLDVIKRWLYSSSNLDGPTYEALLMLHTYAYHSRGVITRELVSYLRSPTAYARNLGMENQRKCGRVRYIGKTVRTTGAKWVYNGQSMTVGAIASAAGVSSSAVHSRVKKSGLEPGADITKIVDAKLSRGRPVGSTKRTLRK